jgi:hypothetical protein
MINHLEKDKLLDYLLIQEQRAILFLHLFQTNPDIYQLAQRFPNLIDSIFKTLSSEAMPEKKVYCTG